MTLLSRLPCPETAAASRAPAPIAVLLATYNGAPHLQDQLESLARQTGAAWQLLWRDDGSTDATVAVMERFAAAHPGRVLRIPGPAWRIGVAASYHLLARAAPPGCPLAFCDQDDVWLPEKLRRAQAALAALPNPGPALYCARQVLTDAALRPLGLSLPVRRAPNFAMALAANIATGCTVLLNVQAADLFRAIPPPPPSLHDWWAYLLVTGAGGQVVIDPEPALLYRQHGRNLVGAPQTSWRRAIAALRRGPHAFMHIFRAQVAALHAAAPALTPEAAHLLEKLTAALAAGPASRLACLAQTPLRRQTRLESLLFGVWFLLG